LISWLGLVPVRLQFLFFQGHGPRVAALAALVRDLAIPRADRDRAWAAARLVTLRTMREFGFAHTACDWEIATIPRRQDAED